MFCLLCIFLRPYAPALQFIVWRCCSRLESTGHVCYARTVNEEHLKEAVVEAINQVFCKKDDFLKTLQANIATVIKQGDTLSPEVIDERLRELQKELVKMANQKDDYDAISSLPNAAHPINIPIQIIRRFKPMKIRSS